MSTLQHLMQEYKSKQPTVVFEWKDDQTDAEGWVVINSLRGGAAGGGTRMRKGLNRYEVESLAKVMEIKFTVSGPSIGGAKSGINFDPNDPRKDEVLQRWFKAVMPILKNYYGTGGDLNVDEIKHVIPITEEYGLWHPQEGIVNGHFNPSEAQKIKKIGQLRNGVVKKLEDPIYTPSNELHFTVADMITGYGVAEAVKHYYQLYKSENLNGKRAIIQGWGNVSGGAAYYLSQAGVKIVGIIDRAGGLIDTTGLTFEQVKNLILERENNQLVADEILPFDETNQAIWDVKADIFIPGAASRLVSREQVDKMIAGGLEVISCGANVPFEDDDLFYGPTAAFTDEHVALIPDFIANCGMARVFGYLMQDDVEISDQGIFQDVSETIKIALEKVQAVRSEPNQIASTALQLSLEKLV